jgi:iron complex transport system substrate-binding protein
MNANKVSGAVADCSMKIHEALGPGLLESVYQRILSYELRKADFEVETEVPISVEWDGKKIDEGYRADLIVNQQMLVELKSVEKLDVVHSKQVLTYLKLTNLNLGLLINFGAPFLKEGIRRIVNNLKEKNLCVSTALREASTHYYESRKPFFLRAQAS